MVQLQVVLVQVSNFCCKDNGLPDTQFDAMRCCKNDVFFILEGIYWAKSKSGCWVWHVLIFNFLKIKFIYWKYYALQNQAQLFGMQTFKIGTRRQSLKLDTITWSQKTSKIEYWSTKCNTELSLISCLLNCFI